MRPTQRVRVPPTKIETNYPEALSINAFTISDLLFAGEVV